MSIQSELSRLESNIASAYTMAGSMGATMPAIRNSANLSVTLRSILQLSFDGEIYNFELKVENDGSLIFKYGLAEE